MPFIIGTRGSNLALIQANQIKEKIEAVTNQQVILKLINTQGDLNQQQPLSDIGGKGVFIKNIEKALVEKEIDVAVHSLKDVTSTLHQETELTGFFTPESRADCVLMIKESSIHHLEDIPKGMTVATSSIRRKALLSKFRPDLKVKDIRGNVETRITKCQKGMADGLILSEAGLIRLGLESKITCRLDPEWFIPAPGQGVVTIQNRKESTKIVQLIKKINDQEQVKISHYERYFMKEVGLDCNDPLGLYTQVNKENITMKVFWATRDGTKRYETIIKETTESIHPVIKKIAAKIKTDSSRASS